MRPFNVYVEGSADELPGAITDALEAVFPDGEDHGGGDTLAKDMLNFCSEVVAAKSLGDNVTRYALNVGGASADGGTSPEAVLNTVQLNVRALQRGDNTSSGEPAQQV